jgi:hypothetical protein
MRFDWKFILAAVLAIHVCVGTADAGLFHDMEDVGKRVVVDAAIHEGEKVVARDAERKAAEESTGKIYSKHSMGGRTVYKNTKIDSSLTDKHGLSNLDRMKKGLSPVDEYGKPFHIHHVIQDEPGPVAEVNQAVHQRFYKALRGLRTQTSLSQEERNPWTLICEALA